MGFNREKPHAFRCSCGDHYWARLSRGYVTLVSQEDASLLGAYKWSAIPKPAKGRTLDQGHQRVTAMRSIDGRGTVQLHREVMGHPQGHVIDHKNGNALDNRRQNLRITNQSMNTANSRKRSGTYSAFKGVSFDRGIWRAAIECGGKRIDLGSHKTEIDAANAYKVAAIAAYGEFARFE